MAINATYQKEMPAALAGQVSDTSRYNVDGACVFTTSQGHSPELLCGLAVRVNGVMSDGVKDIQRLSETTHKPYGVAIRSHFATVNRADEMVYLDGDGINVLTVGRVWMISDSNTLSPTFGEQVHLDTQGRCTASTTANKITTTWTYAGGKTSFGTGNDAIHLLEVQLRQG